MELTKANIIILASAHNPGIVSPQWLKEKNIILEEPTNFVHTPDVSVFDSETFSLIVDRQRLQVATKKMDVDSLDTLAKVSGKYIELLSQIPYKGLGLNFSWITQKDKNDRFPQISINIDSLNGFSSILPNHELNYGCIIYARKDPYLLKLTIEPQMKDVLTYNFNYHHEVSDLESGKIKEYINSFKELFINSKKIVEDICSIREKENA